MNLTILVLIKNEMQLSLKYKKQNFLNPLTIFILYMFIAVGRFLPINRYLMLILVAVIVYKGILNFQKTRQSKTMVPYMSLIIYNMIILLLNPSSNGLYYFFVQLISFTFIFSISLGSMDDFYLKKLSKLFNYFFYGFSVIFIFALYIGEVSMTEGSFALGIFQVIYGLSFFVLYLSKRPILWLFWIIFMPFMSGERGLAISLLFMFLIYYLLPVIKKSKFLYHTFFWIIASLVTSFQFFYVWFSTTTLGTTFNLISGKYTNQNFFSGRQIIWGILNDYIISYPVLGYGFGNDILKQYNIFMSAHNTYVEILLSGGLIYLLLFFLFMYSIWSSMYEFISEKSIRLSMSFLIAILIFGANGVIFVGNDISFTLIIWLIIGISLMRRNYFRNENYGYRKNTLYE